MTGYKRAKAELIIASVQGRWEICSKSTVGTICATLASEVNAGCGFIFYVNVSL